MHDLPYVTPTRAAEILGISRALIYRLLQRDPSLYVAHPDLGRRLISHDGLERLRLRNRVRHRPKRHP